MSFKLVVTTAALIMTLLACSKNENSASNDSGIKKESSSIPAHWAKHESKDSMTDKITKSYDIASNESTSHGLSVACSKKGFLNFYIEYPNRTGMPSAMTEVKVRIDGDTPFTENWYVGWVNGATTIENPYDFLQKIKGKKKLAIEIFAATNSTFNIEGIEQVVSDMEATACQFENKNVIKKISASEMPKFAAICEGDNRIPFILITEPEKERLFFSRQDHQYDPSISTKLTILEKSIEATIESPCCKNSPGKLIFNRQTGELNRQFSNGGQTMKCEKLDENLYQTELNASIQHYSMKLKEAEDKAATESAAATQLRQDQINKANSPNKF